MPKTVQLDICDGCGKVISDGAERWETEIGRQGITVTYCVTHPNARCAIAAERNLGMARAVV